ncbi:hypothetical protein D3C84_1194400 [compost metagenome]
MAGDHQTTTGIGQLAAALIADILQPTGEEARHEGIAGAQYIEHFHLHTRINGAVF